MPKIVIRLKNDGSIEAEGVEFQGEGCIEATKFLNELFGSPEELEYKDEFYIRTKAKDALMGGGGFCG